MNNLRKIYNWCKRQLSKITFIFKKPSIHIREAALSGDGSFIDIRYYLTRPDKLCGKEQIYLIDETTGGRYNLMRITKFGTIKTRHSRNNGSGVLLFRNHTNSLQPGSRVTLIFGEFKVNNIEIKDTSKSMLISK